MATIRRGELAYAEGEVLAAPGSGELLRRDRTLPGSVSTGRSRTR